MGITWSVVISAIALVVSILSPILTAWIRNRHEWRMFLKREIELHTRDAIEDYVSCASRIIIVRSGEAMSEYRRAYSKMLLFVSLEMSQLMAELDQLIAYDSNRTLETDKLNSICELLQEYYPRLEKQSCYQNMRERIKSKKHGRD